MWIRLNPWNSKLQLRWREKNQQIKAKNFWHFGQLIGGGGDIYRILFNLCWNGKNNYDIYELMFIKGVNYHVCHEKKHKNINNQTQEYNYSFACYLLWTLIHIYIGLTFNINIDNHWYGNVVCI